MMKLMIFLVLAGTWMLAYSQNCGAGEFLDPAAEICVNCSIPLANCISCTNSSHCVQCVDGFNVVEGDCIPNNMSCDPLSFKDPITGNCVKCSTSIPNCDYCENSNTCLICADGYQLHGQSCQKIEQSSCLSGTYFDPISSACVNCTDAMSNCTQCLNATTCLECEPGMSLENSTCIESMANITCGSGQYLNINTGLCQNCSDAMANCTACQNDTICIQCTGGTVLMNGTCGPASQVCPMGTYFSSQTGGCSNCSDVLSNCTACDNATFCTNCTQGTMLVGGKCPLLPRRLRRLDDSNETLMMYSCGSCGSCSSGNCDNKCKDGYYNRYGHCYKCPYGCLKCKYSGYKTICLDCDKGFYLNKYKCYLCSDFIDNCVACKNQYSCIACDYGYFSSGSSCKLCSQYMDKCANCNDQYKCIECDPPAVLNRKTCQCECPITNCEVCSDDYKSCKKCSSGCYSKKGKCYSCHPTCEECSAYGAKMCTSCPDHSSLYKDKRKKVGYCKCDSGYDFDWQAQACV